MSAENKKKSGCCGPGCLLIFAVPILLFVLMSASVDSSNQRKQEEYRSAISAMAGASNQEKFELAAKYVYGNDLIEARAGNEYPTVSGKYSGKPDTIRTLSCAEAVDMLERIHEIRELHGFEFTEIQFQTYTALVDAYGNERDGVVLSFGITEDALDRINFENMLSTNIPNVAVNWYEHPAMKK